MTEYRKPFKKAVPVVDYEYPDLPRNPSPRFHSTHFKTRLIHYAKTPKLLDIRQYSIQEGWSAIGLAFTLEQLEALQEIIPHAIALMKKNPFAHALKLSESIVNKGEDADLEKSDPFEKDINKC